MRCVIKRTPFSNGMKNIHNCLNVKFNRKQTIVVLLTVFIVAFFTEIIKKYYKFIVRIIENCLKIDVHSLVIENVIEIYTEHKNFKAN